jgi:hypothetical protein
MYTEGLNNPMKSSWRLARYKTYIRKRYLSVKAPEFFSGRICLRSELDGKNKHWIFLCRSAYSVIEDDTVIVFLDIVHHPVSFILKNTFRRIDFVSVLRLEPIQLGPISRATPS